ncbi:MAG: AMP-binding protein [Spirochaetes bacterium]|nr:AMP-binding protein [Spirochaetota bacterium]MBU1079531.1 AMP-binding protein [Spirochaetota bacterium]
MDTKLAEIPFRSAARFKDRVSHQYRAGNETVTRTYEEFARLIRVLTAGFDAAGVEKGAHVAFFVNNRFEWIATDFALMILGAVSVPRGSDTTPKEAAFIFGHSDSEMLILENRAQLEALDGVFTAEDWERCRRIFIVDGDGEGSIPRGQEDKITTYSDLETLGGQRLDGDPGLVERKSALILESDLLTIVYTSGTTGNPKGVMLSHANFLQNVTANTPRLEIDPEASEATVVMLPSWHVYERAFEYCGLASGLRFIYSTAGRFSADLAKERPHLLISVPRVWESVYQKLIKALSEMGAGKRYLIFSLIKLNQVWLSSEQYLRGCYISLKRRSFPRKAARWALSLLRVVFLYPGHRIAHALFKPFREKVGGRLRVATCGAGSLPKYLDELFNSIGITIVNAYGMTECAPGILSRTIERNTFGSAGIPFDNTEVVIRREDGGLAGTGEKGVVFCRGPQVMSGYYKNPDATRAVLSDDGWLNTGDLAVRSENGEIVIVGRLKDTIVLMGGENVEPEPIEDKIKESSFIDHAVVIGQDRKQLSAIVAVNEDELMRLAGELKLSPADISLEGSGSIENDAIYKILLDEVNSLISREHGFKAFEFISRILPVRNDFSIGRELTQTLKIKRKYIEEKYRGLIEKLFHDTHERNK